MRLQDGRVSESGQTISDPSYRVKQGAVFQVSVPEAAEAAPAPQDIPLTIVYEDRDLLVWASKAVPA